MSDFEKICTRAQLPKEGHAKEFALANGRPICVALVSGQISAMDNECPHNGGPLAEGIIEHGRVVCPWHGWAFDLHTGEAEHNSAAKVEVFETKVDGDDVLVKA
jgi:nitrite reductase (NADH) small subunit